MCLIQCDLFNQRHPPINIEQYNKRHQYGQKNVIVWKLRINKEAYLLKYKVVREKINKELTK